MLYSVLCLLVCVCVCVFRYHSVEHSDFVHGLAQDPLSGAMVTCSWDGRVVTHHVGVDAGEEDVGGAKMDSDK